MPGENLPAVPDPTERDRVPVFVEKLGEMPPGKTVFHQHPEGKEMWQLLCLLRLDQRGGKKVNLREVLAIEWPDFQVSDTAFAWFVEHYVDPLVVVPPEFFRKGLLKADANLDHVSRIAEVAKKMEVVWDDMRENAGKVIDTDDEGNPIFGPTHEQVIKMGERVQKAYERQAEAAASVGMAPKKERAGGLSLHLGSGPPQFNVDLRGAVGSGFAPPKDAIETEGRQKS